MRYRKAIRKIELYTVIWNGRSSRKQKCEIEVLAETKSYIQKCEIERKAEKSPLNKWKIERPAQT